MLVSVAFVACQDTEGQAPGALSADLSARATESAAWRLSLLVRGKQDLRCLIEGTPEPLQVDISRAHEHVESLAIPITSPARFLEPPFAPNADDRTFLERAADAPSMLADAPNAARYRSIALAAFTAATSPKLPLGVKLQVLKTLNTANLSFTLDVTMDRLLETQDWFERVHQKLPEVPTLGESLLLFGTVIRTGTSPPFVVAFSSADTIVSGGAQNEAHDTVLCQIRTGIFDVGHEPRADIAILRVLDVQRLGM
jgi:hypothetical protein